jgi:hypothetical protein
MNKARIWWIVAAALAAVLVWHAWDSAANHDEVEHMHAAWMVSIGEKPFADFFEQHPPVYWMLLSPVAGITSSPQVLAFIARLFDLGCLAGMLVVFARLVRRVEPAAAGPWPVLLLFGSYVFTRNMMVVRPDPLMTLCSFGGLLAWFDYLETPRLSRAVIAGLLFGAAIAVLQKALVMMALVMAASGIVFLMRKERRRALLIGTIVLGACAVIPVALLCLVAWRGGWLSDMWFCNVPFNRYFYLEAPVAARVAFMTTLFAVLGTNPVVVALGLAGFDRRVLEPERLTLAIVLVGFMGMLATSSFPLAQYYLVPLPILGVFAARWFVHELAWVRLAVRIATVGVVGLFVAALIEYEGVGRFLRVQEDLLAKTTPAQSLFVPPNYNPIFRRDAGYFWYNGVMTAEVYGNFCRDHACPGEDKRTLDDRMWAESPPVFVWISAEYPWYLPYHWPERSKDYQSTDLPSLWVRVKR